MAPPPSSLGTFPPLSYPLLNFGHTTGIATSHLMPTSGFPLKGIQQPTSRLFPLGLPPVMQRHQGILQAGASLGYDIQNASFVNCPHSGLAVSTGLPSQTNGDVSDKDSEGASAEVVQVVHTSNSKKRGHRVSEAAAKRKERNRENEVTRRTNLNDLVTVVERAVLRDMNRMDRFADKVTVLECTARLLHEKYGLRSPVEVEEDESDGSQSEREFITSSTATASEQDLACMDRNMRKTIRERQRRRAMNKHLFSLRKMLGVEAKDKKAVLNAVIDFFHDKVPAGTETSAPDVVLTADHED